MGRNKIKIEPITNERNRQATFTKRKGGLFKKAMELSILCTCKVALLVITAQGRLYEYGSHGAESVLQDYTKFRSSGAPLLQSVTNSSYSKFEKGEDLGLKRGLEESIDASIEDSSEIEDEPRPKRQRKRSSASRREEKTPVKIENSATNIATQPSVTTIPTAPFYNYGANNGNAAMDNSQKQNSASASDDGNILRPAARIPARTSPPLFARDLSITIPQNPPTWNTQPSPRMYHPVSPQPISATAPMAYAGQPIFQFYPASPRTPTTPSTPTLIPFNVPIQEWPPSWVPTHISQVMPNQTLQPMQQQQQQMGSSATPFQTQQPPPR